MQIIPWTGTQIIEPGIYSNIPLSDYHKADICDGPSVSSSGLRTLFRKSPAHFYDAWPGNPDYFETPDKEEFIIGRATHHLVLGETFFARLFVGQPDEYQDQKTGEIKPWSNNSTVAKVWNAEQARLRRAILKPAMMESIRGMTRALLREPIVADGALSGEVECSIFWKDKLTGLWLKSRPDAIPTSDADFVDLKTTTSVLWPDIQNAMAKFGYHQQGALVREAAREVLGLSGATFTLIFVEKTRPHCVETVTPIDDELDRGEKQNRYALDVIARCLKSNQWPGPGGQRRDAAYIELPEWAHKQIDDKLKFGI